MAELVAWVAAALEITHQEVTASRRNATVTRRAVATTVSPRLMRSHA